MTASQPRPTAPHLRLFQPTDDTGGDSLSSGLTLSQFFAGWFLEHVLRTQERKASTATLYRDALAWWSELTGDPPLAQIDQATVNGFRERLRTATYKRGLAGSPRKLEKPTVDKHLRAVRALLKACGPQLTPHRPAARILAEVPLVHVKKQRVVPKDCFTAEQVCRLVEASQSLEGMACPGVAMRDFWPAAYCTYFYTGVRRQTGLMLLWPWVRVRRGQHWIEIEDEAVPKTDKGKAIVAHPTLLAACGRIRAASPDARLLPWSHTADHLLDVHYEIQSRAGIPPAEQIDLQGLRRTFANELFLLGAEVGIQIARESLDHADAATTVGHYVTYNRLIPRLPAIWSPRPAQRLLF